MKHHTTYPARQWRRFIWLFANGWNTADIAEHYRCHESTVYNALTKRMQTLRSIRWGA